MIPIRTALQGWALETSIQGEVLQLKATSPTNQVANISINLNGRVVEVVEGDLVRIITGNLVELVLGDAIRKVTRRSVQWSGEYTAINGQQVHLNPAELKTLEENTLPQQLLSSGACASCPSPS